MGGEETEGRVVLCWEKRCQFFWTYVVPKLGFLKDSVAGIYINYNFL